MLSLLSFIFLLPLAAQSLEAGQDYVVRHDTKTEFMVESVGGVQGRKLKYFNGVVAHLTPAQADKLKAKGYRVEKVIPMHILGKPTVFKVMDDEFQIPWGVRSVQAPAAQKLKNGSGEGVTVCVVDTGIDPFHPALKESVTGGEAIVKYVSPDKPFWFDDNGHGTHVSGTIAAHAEGLLGVAPQAKLFAIKVLNASGSGTDTDVAEGIKACIGHGQVINMSLGGGEPSKIIQEALDAAVEAGIMLACAAGNDGGPVLSPANQKGCVAVSAINEELKLADFSNKGPEVKFTAPGVNVRSSVPGGKFDTWNGTSMATPHVAGTMAVMLSREKKMLKAKNLHLPVKEQGAGEINTLLTAQ